MLTYPCHIVLQIRHLEILGAGLSFCSRDFLKPFFGSLSFFSKVDFLFQFEQNRQDCLQVQLQP